MTKPRSALATRAACLAGLLGSLAAAAPAGAQSCPPSASQFHSPAQHAAAVERQRRKIERLGEHMQQRGCTGSVIVIRGTEGNVCVDLQGEMAALESELRGFVAGRPAQQGVDDCIQGNEQQPSYSQFRTPFGRGSIIELRGDETSVTVSPVVPAPQPAALDGDAAAAVPATPPEPEIVHEIIDLDERLEERDVRVVGPEFLPDQSEAIDLKAPAQSFYP